VITQRRACYRLQQHIRLTSIPLLLLLLLLLQLMLASERSYISGAVDSLGSHNMQTAVFACVRVAGIRLDSFRRDRSERRRARKELVGVYVLMELNKRRLAGRAFWSVVEAGPWTLEC